VNAVETIKAQLRFLQEMEAKEIIENAEEQAKKIVKEAEENADKIKKQKMEKLAEKLREKEALEIATRKLEGRKKNLTAESELLERALTESTVKLREICEAERSLYEESLERLVIEAAARLKGTQFQVLTNSKDKRLVKEKLRELEKKISKMKGVATSLQVSEETLNIMGGVMLQTADKKQVFNNTFEARLTKLKEEMVSQVFSSLFEGEDK
jgi:V/A-type H+-transporting ATPase subunit E